MQTARLGKLDRLGVWASLACAAHCAAMPILALGSLFAGQEHAHAHGPFDHWLELLLIGTAALVGYSTLGVGFRQHGRPGPLVVLTTGLLLVGAGHLAPSHSASILAAITGALALVAAQLLNRRCPTACRQHDPA